jgi:hypothetical protein
MMLGNLMSMSVSHLDFDNHLTIHLEYYPHHHTGTCSYQPLAFQKSSDPKIWTILDQASGATRQGRRADA